MAELAGGGQVWAGAEVEPFPLTVDADFGIRRQGLDVLGGLRIDANSGAVLDTET